WPLAWTSGFLCSSWRRRSRAGCASPCSRWRRGWSRAGACRGPGGCVCACSGLRRGSRAARCIGRSRGRGGGQRRSAPRVNAPDDLDDPVLAQLLAQGGAVDAQQRRGAALVAVAVVQYFHEQRDLELAQGDLVEVVGGVAVEVPEVAAHGVRHVLAQGRSEERRVGKEGRGGERV